MIRRLLRLLGLKSPLQQRYAAILLPGLAIGIGLSVMAFAADQILTAQHRLETRTARLVDITRLTTAAAVWETDIQRIDGTLSSLMVEPAFAYAVVTDEQGRKLASAGSTDYTRDILLFPPLRYHRALTHEQADGSRQVIGTLDVAFTQREIAHDLVALIVETVGAFLVLLGGVLMLILTATRRFVLEPVESLVGAIRKVRRGVLDHAPPQGSGEIRELVNAFNGMVDGLSEGEAAKAALKQSEERFALAVAGAADGIWDWDASTGQAYFSPTWWHIVALIPPRRPLVLEDWLTAIHIDDRQRVEDVFEAHRCGRTDHLSVEHRLADAGERWVEVRGLAVRGPDGQATRMAGSLTDITDRKRSEAALLHVALHDSLTGLANRTVVIERLTHLISQQAAGATERHAVFFLDLDRFKTINDTLGHMAGDNLLTQTGERLRNLLGGRHTLARLGGDEFCVIAEDVGHRHLCDRYTSIARCEEIAQSIIDAVEKPFEINGTAVHISTSIGICLVDRDYLVAIDTLRDADIAMYRAKESGSGRFAVFDPATHAAAIGRLETEAALRRAIREGEFEAWFQPVVDLETRNTVGFETLARWNRPERGLVPPGNFIPLAESHGLISAIGFDMMEQAAKAALSWHQSDPAGRRLSVAVNVSTRQLTEPDFLTRVEQVVERVGPDHAMKLEITESGLLADSVHLRDLFLRLRDFGFRLSIDDFGTGHSSLSHIDRFPFDELKIDRSFVLHIATSVRQRRLVKAILALADTMGLGVVAEGVETEMQASVLTELGCPLAQGYLFARPMNRGDADRFLAQQPSCRSYAFL